MSPHLPGSASRPARVFIDLPLERAYRGRVPGGSGAAPAGSPHVWHMAQPFWNPWTLLLLASAAGSVVLGWLIIRARPWAPMNRWAGALLLMGGVIFTATSAVPVVVGADAFRILGVAVTILVAWDVLIHLQVVGHLASPLSSWLGRRWVVVVTGAVALGATVSMLVRPELAVASLVPSNAFAFNWEPGPVRGAILGLFILVNLLGLVAALDSIRHSPPENRAKARGFALAFGVRDVLFIGLFAAAAVALAEARYELPLFVAFALANFLFVGLLAYAVLKEQLFDIDLKIKAGLGGTIVATMVALIILVVSEAVEKALGVNQVLPAVATAAAVSLILRPLHRLGTRAADHLMPGVQDDAAYRASRKRQVYEAALAAAIRDGHLDAREREALAALADELGLAASVE